MWFIIFMTSAKVSGPAKLCIALTHPCIYNLVLFRMNSHSHFSVVKKTLASGLHRIPHDSNSPEFSRTLFSILVDLSGIVVRTISIRGSSAVPVSLPDSVGLFRRLWLLPVSLLHLCSTVWFLPFFQGSSIYHLPLTLLCDLLES